MANPRETAITFERATGTIGAFVRGVDLHDLPRDDGADVLCRALAEHGVLFFRSEPPVTDEEFESLAELFGGGYAYEWGQKGQVRGNVGELDFADAAAAAAHVVDRWHTDGTALEAPPLAGLLSPTVLPGAGGDTLWASMSAAYDALSSRYQRLLDGMEALHTTASGARFLTPELRERVFGSGSIAVHPVVPTDPLTGRRFLYVNSSYTERLVGMSDWESERLLEMLFDHVNTPELHVRLRWQLGMVAVWHERLTQHRAVADFSERRVMRRTTIGGEPPAR